uniref:GNAT family N-acetyltransferase n=1 Tax=Streptomyces sp. NBC_01393 TaxID=2903851 RepID=A0AAU3ICM5_9ACTN
MTTDHGSGPTLTIGERDTGLNDRLTEELVAFNTAATGATDRGTFSIKVADEAGELVGGLAA